MSDLTHLQGGFVLLLLFFLILTMADDGWEEVVD